MNEDEAVGNIQRKIDREKAMINGLNAMRQSTNNNAVLSKIEGQIRDGRRNIEYFESRLQEIQMRRMGSDVANMSLGGDNTLSPGHAGQRGRNPITPPPKDGWSSYNDQDGAYGEIDQNQLSGGHGLMPPKAPYAPPGPMMGPTKARANYSKLDLIKYDTPHLGPRIQLMLSQLEFKLSVEKQYKDGLEKMIRLYEIEKDRKSKVGTEGKLMESNQKIQLLKQALKRYEDLHVDIEGQDSPDDDSLNVPSARKPLTGHLSIKIHAVQDVDHAASGRFSRGPDTFIVMKVEDAVKGRTKASRTDRWTEETHEFDIEKANEIELTVYDKTGENTLPIGMLWIRIADIAEEMRRKKIESEFNSAGWVSADKMGGGQQPQFQPPPGQNFGPGGMAGGMAGGMGGGAPAGSAPQTGPMSTDAWFSLEPVGRIHLTMGFVKQTKDKKNFDVGLGRKGAIRQRKEDVHEQYGHKFIQQQFYNIMRCAYCGEFLRYAAGMQCADCRYTCHKKCYTQVVTKCITQSNAETKDSEIKLNHRIHHRFDVFSNMGANWCCHCGYILPLGRKQSRRCTECNLTCHSQCVHFVPDYCGMTSQQINMALRRIQEASNKQGNLTATLQPTLRTAKPSPSPSYSSHSATSSQGTITQESRLSYNKEDQYANNLQQQSFSQPSAQSVDAARASYTGGQPTSPTAQRPVSGRTQSSQPPVSAASAAAAAALQGQGKPPAPIRSSTDYPQNQNTRTSANYASTPQHQPPQQPAYDPGAYQQFTNASGPGPLGYGMPQPQTPQSSSYAIPQPSPQQIHHPIQQTPNQPPPQAQQQPTINVPSPGGRMVAKPDRVTPPANTQGTGRRIGLDHFNFLAVLGKGNFGKVMLAETKASKQLYAIKVLKKEFIIENDEVESTRSEKRVFLIANKERHPFLLNLHACFQTETRVYFVMEYISGGDLMLHIQRGQFGTKRAQFYAAEVCLALKYFHENGVIYRDLKLDNILLTMDGHIKIADYGLCKEDMWYGSTTGTFCGTPEFMAPEIILDKKYGRAVDWWAFGVLIYQMLLQQSPFRGEEDEIYDAILADDPLYPIHMPRDSVSILQKLLTREPELRLGSGPTDAQEIMSHAFFRNVNWEDVYHKRVPAPFLPQITNATDTSNFDSEFTSVTPVLTPVQSVLSQAMQEEFRGFSYSADFV